MTDYDYQFFETESGNPRYRILAYEDDGTVHSISVHGKYAATLERQICNVEASGLTREVEFELLNQLLSAYDLLPNQPHFHYRPNP